MKLLLDCCEVVILLMHGENVVNVEYNENGESMVKEC